MKAKRLIPLFAFLLAGAINPFSAHAPARGLENTVQNQEEDFEEETPVKRTSAIKRIREYEETERNKISEREFYARVGKKDGIYGQIDYLFRALRIPDNSYITREFIRAVVSVESSDNPWAVSYMKARGLMQIVEETWKKIEKNMNYYSKVFQPLTNLDVGIRHFLDIDKECQELYPNWGSLTDSEKKTISSICSNWGIGNFQRSGWNMEKLPVETRNHVKRVRALDESYASVKARYAKSKVWKLY